MSLLLHLVDILFFAWVVANLARATRMPPLLGMLAGGVLAEAIWSWLPALNTETLPLTDVSGPLRMGVLTLVLIRAGLSLSPRDLRQAGALAMRVGSIPMLFEGVALAAAAHLLLSFAWPSALVLGFLVAAVSPAIVVPGLLELLDRPAKPTRSAPGGSSTAPRRRILVALLAGAPLDNVLALALFGAFLDLAVTGGGTWGVAAWHISSGLLVSVASGVLVGGGLALALGGSSAIANTTLTGAASWVSGLGVVALLQHFGLPVAPGLVALGCTVRWRSAVLADSAVAGLSLAWKPAAYLLFGLIGADFDARPLLQVGAMAVLVLGVGQGARALGTMLATSGMGLKQREQLACVAAYVPKATIQAAFAALPMERGLADGPLVMGIAVLAIAISAPVGALTLMRGVPTLLRPEGFRRRTELEIQPAAK